MATEYLLSLNKFDRPKKYVDKQGKAAATQTLITRLILMEPGTFQHHPQMGVGIVSRYRYSDTEDLSMLEDDIKWQMATYIPSLRDASVRVTQSERIIHINIIGNDLVYTADYDTSTMRLSEL